MATGAKKAVYPLFQLGGPQLRIFRPNFFMLAVRPGVPQPEDTVQFRVSMEMTKVDIKNYLEKIYNVPVAAVRTRIQYGANNKRNHKNQRVKKPDYKVAYVQLEGLCFGGQILPPGLSVLGFCLQEIRQFFLRKWHRSLNLSSLWHRVEDGLNVNMPRQTHNPLWPRTNLSVSQPISRERTRHRNSLF
ncbi:39S ribosomal protein L23, mitochondrial isoform X2 [Aquila chrysaetos chrysaetos]|uniref:39S ribosomal protein L23, mitochondrial isoform X2 n=1 Tax=Aquila chrysaetos chrysaetos TaxID=223781 RepID=UPI001176AB6D|nr:39S ribosomal protein L23, mitochondrial isoform X2 [Aquila chrysaetos chrysaetos]